MHLLSVLSLRNRSLIALVTVVVAIFGVVALTHLKQELIPSVQFPQVAIVSTYPGATPEVVSDDVSTKIEQGIQAVPDLKDTTATSSTGQSVVTAEFQYGSNLASAEDKIQTVVNALDLPDGVQTQIVTGSFDDIPVLQLAVSDPGTSEETLVDRLDKTAVPDLEKLDGVREADVYGNPGRRVVITPDETKLAERGVTQTAISDALDDNGTLVPGGTITEHGKTLSVQTGSALGSVGEIRALPLSGARVASTIGDVATVALVESPRTSISRVNGKPALTVAITKTQAANTVDVSRTVQAALPHIESQVDGNPHFTVVFDQAPYIEQSIDSLAEEGLLGLGFAVVVILVFLLSWRSTIVTAISIPTSVLLAAIGMQAAGYTLNIITLAGLTIAIGRVVDDSIVVVENIKRHMQPGVDRLQAVLDGVREVAGAVTASTLTTVVVFLPVAFVQELVGELFRPFALTVSMALAASLLVALTIVPVLAYWFLRPGRGAVRGVSGAGAAPVDPAGADRAAPAGLVAVESRFADAPPGGTPALRSAADLHDAGHADRLRRGYLPVLHWVLRFPALVLVLAVLVLGGTAAALPLVRTNYLGDSGQNTFTVSQTLAPATSLAEQSRSAQRVERALRDVHGVDTVQVTIGSSGNSLQAAFGGGGTASITYSVTTDSSADQTALQATAREHLRRLSGVGTLSLTATSGFGSTSDIDVDVTAPTQAQLRTAAQQVLHAMQDVPNTTAASSNLSAAQPYLAVRVDRAAATAAGLTETQVGGIVAASISPQDKGTVEFGDQTLDVYIENPHPPTTVAALRALAIPTARGAVPLSSLATIAQSEGPTTVTTSNAVRTATITVTPSPTNLGAATQSVTAAVDGLHLPKGAEASIGGVASSQSSAFGQLLLAALIAILIVYVVMVATFRSLLQPLLLLVSIPFAATGAILLQVVSGIPIGVASLIGVLMLVGIVVTNAIVLIDLVNQYRRRGLRVSEALVEGATRRLRPILMTALATIFALVPMAVGITGKNGFISQPLALVVIGGLVSSTLLTLVVLPALYFVVERPRERYADARAAVPRSVPDRPVAHAPRH